MSIKIIFKEENEKLFWEQWNKFVSDKNLSIRYTEINVKHFLSFLDLYKDRSFVYLENNEPMACAFLPIEKNEENLSISFMGGYVDAPIASNKKVQKKIFGIIDEIARENKVSQIKFAVDVFSGERFNYLMQYGYLNSSILTYIFDLSQDLLLSCRKGHKSDIKTALKNKDFKTFFVDKNNPSEKLFREYIELHHKCSGRVTRSQITFDMQFEKIKTGKAFLVGLEYDGKNVAYVYFEYNADKAIYASTADDPDYDKLQLYHILVFKAMEYLKEKGARAVDTGQPSCPSSQFDYYIDKKQENIALFKRGFGGYFKENFRGIKYFSEEAFKKDAKKFIDNYSKSFYEKV
ncbi:MAG: GNAT family N-acetyltransferase [Patescibacteria group bacterium]